MDFYHLKQVFRVHLEPIRKVSQLRCSTLRTSPKPICSRSQQISGGHWQKRRNGSSNNKCVAGWCMSAATKCLGLMQIPR